MLVLTILISSALGVCWAFMNEHHSKERDLAALTGSNGSPQGLKQNRKWKNWQWGVWICVAVIPIYTHYAPLNIEDFFVGLKFWFVTFDTLVGYLRTGQIFYLGDTAKPDVWIKKIFGKKYRIWVGTIKSLTLIVTIISYLLIKYARNAGALDGF